MGSDLILVKTMSSLLDPDADRRSKFMAQNVALIKTVIPLLKVATGKEGYLESALHCLCIISEINNKEIIDSLIGDSNDLEFWKLIQDFEANSEEVVQLKFAYLVNCSINEDHCSILANHLISNCDFIVTLLTYISSANVEKNLVSLAIDLLMNLCRTETIKNHLLQESEQLHHLLEIIFKKFDEADSDSEKLKLISVLRNLCFKTEIHAELLKPENELLVKLCLPIAGPTEVELDDEDMQNLPIELQYLPPSTERVSCLNLKRAIVDCMLLLCATGDGRNCIRASNIYFLFRELHRREEDKSLQCHIENLVDILIKDEKEYENIEDLTKLDIGQEHLEMFEKLDTEATSSN